MLKNATMAQQATPSYMDPSDRGQRSDLLRFAGLMNGPHIVVQVTACSRKLCAETVLSEQSGSMLHIMSKWQNPDILVFCYKGILHKNR